MLRWLIGGGREPPGLAEVKAALAGAPLARAVGEVLGSGRQQRSEEEEQQRIVMLIPRGVVPSAAPAVLKGKGTNDSICATARRLSSNLQAKFTRANNTHCQTTRSPFPRPCWRFSASMGSTLEKQLLVFENKRLVPPMCL